MKVGGLFSGIGGFELGLQRAGMDIRWHCDSNPWSRHILERHWPGVPCYDDVRELKGTDLEPIDVLCGGFPCQDISLAGKGAGIEGERSSLWGEIARLVGELRPSYVIVENVAALRRRGLDRVLGDLASLGYDAEWDGLRAADFGAPHRRDRIWIVAYPNADERGRGAGQPDVHARQPDAEGLGERGPRDLSDANGTHAQGNRGTVRAGTEQPGSGNDGAHGRAVADADPVRWDRGPRVFGPGWWAEFADRRAGLAEAWAVEPDVGRVADGIPARVDRLTGLGNALVPQIAEWIGHRIQAYELGSEQPTVPGLDGR